MCGVRVIGPIRKLGQDGKPVEPMVLDQIEADAEDYATARSLAEAKLPSGWQLMDWTVPDHLPD